MRVTGRLRPDEALATYLEDHRAGARGGVAVARRLADAHDGTRLGLELTELASDVAWDADALDQVLDRLDVRPSRTRMMAAEAGRVASSLAPHGRLVGRSALADVLELEELRAGIAAKRQLWLALRDVAGVDHPGIDLALMLRRADTQLERVDGLWHAVATEAFAEDGHDTPAAPRQRG